MIQAIVFLTNRTLPSVINAFTPPEWALEAANETLESRPQPAHPIRQPEPLNRVTPLSVAPNPG